jgi:5-(carboxyamino)imidazole ribonucleotide synthase
MSATQSTKRSSSSPAFRVGILGGGQLARMLVEDALPLGLEPVVFTDDPLAPAARVCPWVHLGTIEDTASLSAFLGSVRVVAFENEFIDTARLKQAALGLDLRFEPALDTLHLLQDKLSQKRVLERLRIPSAPWRLIRRGESLPEQTGAIRAEFDQACVFKWSRMGYDGKGVLLTGPETPAETVQRFCEHGFSRPAEVYVEKKICFRRELAMMAVRSIQGDFDAWPLVISEQEAGICRRVWGPATQYGVNPDLEERARSYARRLAEDLGMTGVFALEMFETGEAIC